MSTLLMLGLVASIVVTGFVTLGGYQISSARLGQQLREGRLRQTNLASLSQYLQLALRSRWCINVDLTRNLQCTAAAERSLERLILTQTNWEKIAGTTTAYPGNYAALSGRIPATGSCSAQGSLLSGTDEHPLRLLFEELESDYGCIEWKLRRACSASGGGNETSCPASDHLPVPVGQELYYSLSLRLVPKQSRGLSLVSRDLTGEQVFAILPRTLSSYAAIFRGDLSASDAFSGGPGRPEVADDSIIRFPSGAASDPMVSFHGPVLTNGDLVLPDPRVRPGSAAEPFVRVQFNDEVYLQAGKVMVPCAGSEAGCTQGKRPYPAGRTTQVLSNAPGFGGLKAGVIQDSVKDAGLNCLFPSQFGASPQFAAGCVTTPDTRRLGAVLAALDLTASKTRKSDLMIRKCDGPNSGADRKLGCPADSSSVVATPNHWQQDLLIGLSDRNAFFPQVDLPAVEPVVTVPGESFFDEMPAEGTTASAAPRRPYQVSPAFPVKPSVLSTHFPSGAQWADFSSPNPASPDPRAASTRNTPILRVHLVRDAGVRKSVISRTELGIRDRIEFRLKIDFAREPIGGSPWEALFCLNDHTGDCVSSGGVVISDHPLKKLKLDDSCQETTFTVPSAGSPASEPETLAGTLGLRLRQLACQLKKTHDLIEAEKAESAEIEKQQAGNSGAQGQGGAPSPEAGGPAGAGQSGVANPRPAREALRAGFSREGEIHPLAQLRFAANAARTHLRTEFRSLYQHFKNLRQATGVYAFDGVPGLPLVSEPATGATGDFLPVVRVETFPVPHRHPLLPIAGTAESNPRYYWRSDQLRLQAEVRNARYFPSALRNFQVEFEVFDLAAVDTNGQRNGTVRPMATSWGPNCSKFSWDDPVSCTHAGKIFGDDDGASRVPLVDYPYFRKSPNLLRFVLDRSALLEASSGSASGTSPTNLAPQLLQSCTGPKTVDPSVLKEATPYWQSMRCPTERPPQGVVPSWNISSGASSVPPFFPENAEHRIDPQWSIDRQITDGLVGSPAFLGDSPNLDDESFDPIELLFYDYHQVGGTDVLSVQDSFAAATARLSWDFRRPARFNPEVLELETASNVVIAGGPPSEASQWIFNKSLPVSAYNDSGVLVASRTGDLWYPESTDRLQVHSVLKTCVILPSVSSLVGMMTCDRLKIEPRTAQDGPLSLVGTFMIGQLDLPANLQTPVHFYSLDHPVALKLMRDTGLFRTADDAACPAVYGATSAGQTTPAVFRMNASQKEQYRNCEVASVRGRAIPFTWTAIDPECGWQGSNWNCQAPNWFKRFRVLLLGRKGAL